MSQSLPDRPDLEWLRKTAKQSLQKLRKLTLSARLADAQLAVAREYGFTSWRKLVQHVETLRTSSPRVPELDSSLVASFLRAVGTGKVDAVREALRQVPLLVNAVGPHPFWGGKPQALHVSIETKRRELFDLLLEHGADVNGVNDQYDDWSPLMLAAHREQKAMQDELTRRGARIGISEALLLGDDRCLTELLASREVPKGGSLMMLARTVYAIDRLIKAGVEANVRDKWGNTPIQAMSRMGVKGRPLVERLMAHGVKASPEEYARLGDQTTLAEVAQANPETVRASGVLLAAIAGGHVEMVRWLLELGADANGRSANASHATALHEAAWSGNLAIVRLLVEAGADVKTLDDEHHNTPQGWAATSATITNNVECFRVAEFLRSRHES